MDADICIRFRWIKNGGIRKRISVDVALENHEISVSSLNPCANGKRFMVLGLKSITNTDVETNNTKGLSTECEVCTGKYLPEVFVS